MDRIESPWSTLESLFQINSLTRRVRKDIVLSFYRSIVLSFYRFEAMKRFLTALVAIACFAISIVAGFRAVQKPERVPGFIAEPDIVQLGQRSPGETVRGRATFRNTLPHAIQIVEWSTTCSCAGLSVSEREVPSGGETNLDFEWRIGSNPGTAQQSLSILYHFGEGKLDIANVQLRCHVSGESICEPRQLEFAAGKPSSASIRFPAGRLKAYSFDAAWGQTTCFTSSINGDILTVDYRPTPNETNVQGAGLVAHLSGPANSTVTIQLVVRAAVPKAMPNGGS